MTDTFSTFFKALVIFNILILTPFGATMWRWIIAIVEGWVCYLFCIFGMRMQLTKLNTYNYLIRKGVIPIAHYGDHEYVYNKIMGMCLFGMVSGLGVFGLFTPEMMFSRI